MIKLTVNPETNPCLHSFDQAAVVIGLEGDLSLPGEDLKPAHVKIFEQEGRFFILNLANDPFVTLNQQPFGKKILRNNDVITIGETSILFEGQEEDQERHYPLVDTEEKLNVILEKAIHSPASEVEKQNNLSESSSEVEMRQLEELASNYINDWKEQELLEDFDVEALLKEAGEVESQNDESQTPPPPVAPREVPKPASRSELMHQKGSLKDYYLRELEDETEPTQKEIDAASKFEENQGRWNWKYVGVILILILLIITATLSTFYLSASDKNNEDELKAAAGVADVAMALAYAQMNHGKPHNLNWSDPEFIKNNLLSTLAPKYNPTDTLDSHGQFANNSYFIRIYTSSDLSHFLVIAQPSPSILHWLIPRASIIVDSRQMEMRRIGDLKSLNRILLNPNMLDGTNHNEVGLLIQQGELIPLSAVASKEAKHGFSPPKILGSIRPGAENLIYNAPRYYPFGESFLKKALILSENQGTSQEVALLQNQLKALEKYPNIVLYSPQGMQRATQAQKALNTFFPNNKFLVAYLRLNTKGFIVSSNLLMDDTSSDIAMAAPVIPDPQPIDEEEEEEKIPLKNPQDIKIGEVTLTNPPSDLDTTHPLLLKLCALQANKQHLEKDFDLKLTALLEANKKDSATITDFLQRMENLLKKSLSSYQEGDEKIAKTQTTMQFLANLNALLKTKVELSNLEEHDLIKSLVKLYEDYGDMPLADFMRYIKAAGFEAFVDNHLKVQNKNSQEERTPYEQLVEAQLVHMKQSDNVAELLQNVEKIAQTLNLDIYPDPEIVIAYQAKAKVQVLDKLNDFLMSNDNGLPESEFTEVNRSRIEQIMKLAWVTKQDELEFYLNEFDSRRLKDKQ